MFLKAYEDQEIYSSRENIDIDVGQTRISLPTKELRKT